MIPENVVASVKAAFEAYYQARSEKLDREIRIAESIDAYRVFYVAKFEEAVYVLHAFKKKSTRGKAIPRQDVAVARQRYKEVVLHRPAREEQ